MPSPFIDLANRRFGKLIAISSLLQDCNSSRAGGRKRLYWECKCDCGNTKIVRHDVLSSGRKQSCGCHVDWSTIASQNNKNRLGSGTAAFNSLYRRYSRRAKSKNIEFKLTEDGFYILTSSNCHYCGMPPSQVMHGDDLYGDYVYTGIDRVNNDLGYTIANTRPCCKQCNFAKSDMPEQEFYSWLDRLASRREHIENLLRAGKTQF